MYSQFLLGSAVSQPRDTLPVLERLGHAFLKIIVVLTIEHSDPLPLIFKNKRVRWVIYSLYLAPGEH